MGLSSTASAAGVESVAQLSEFVPLTDTTVTVAGSLAILVLIALSAFFSSSEIAMFSLARHRVESLVEDDVPGAAVVQELKSDPHRLLITILVGNNIVNIAMSSIATALFGIYMSQGQAVVAATFGITAVVLLFGESAPKSYAVENTESWALGRKSTRLNSSHRSLSRMPSSA